MHNHVMPSGYRRCCIIMVATVLLFIYFPLSSTAQDNRAVFGEAATCTIKRSTANMTKGKAGTNTNGQPKIYSLQLNQLGSFDQVSNILPNETVPVEITYPQGKSGEKILLSAEDGGRFENGKRIMVAQLDKQKKVAFNFQVSGQAGIFHINLRKGNDIKIVQLWVGKDPAVSL